MQSLHRVSPLCKPSCCLLPSVQSAQALYTRPLTLKKWNSQGGLRLVSAQRSALRHEPIAVTLLLIVQPLLLFLHHLLLLPSFQMNAGTKKVLILTSFASACILTLLAFRLPAIAISAASTIFAAPPSPGMASMRWSSQWWLQLEGDWFDEKGNEYTSTLELDTSLAYTVCTRRRNGEVRITKSLIYNLHDEVLWGNDGQFILRAHGARGTRAGTILTHIGWASVCKCGSVGKESKFVWTRKGERSLPPSPTEPPPSHLRPDTGEPGLGDACQNVQ